MHKLSRRDALRGTGVAASAAGAAASLFSLGTSSYGAPLFEEAPTCCVPALPSSKGALRALGR
jgi:hypothetical protein